MYSIYSMLTVALYLRKHNIFIQEMEKFPKVLVPMVSLISM